MTAALKPSCEKCQAEPALCCERCLAFKLRRLRPRYRRQPAPPDEPPPPEAA